LHRAEVETQVKACTPEELIRWRKHVMYCLECFQKENNAFEVEECQFLLGLIDERLRQFGKTSAVE